MPYFRVYSTCALLTAVVLSFGLRAANAAEPGSAAANDDDLEEVVVTGTLIRGVAPTGSNVIAISAADVAATGASSTNQLLATIPQIQNMFNDLPQIPNLNGAGGPQNVQVLRPNLRNTPLSNTASGSATLVLVDGHRMVGVGILQSSPDTEAVPPGAIERIEVVTDGSSATYGSDAIGGVINYITRRSFDGIQANVRQGWAPNYKSFDTQVTAGTKFGNTSIYLSYNYAKHDDIFNGDRSYAKQITWDPTSAQAGQSTGRSCNQANITVPGLFLPQFNFTLPGATYAYPGLSTAVPNICDNVYRNTALYPDEARHTFFAGLSRDFGGSVKFDMRGFYTNRSALLISGPITGSATVNVVPPGAATQPFYFVRLPGADGFKTQTVAFSFGPVLGERSARSINTFDEWGITPTISWDINSNWQLRGMLNFGSSSTKVNSNGVDPNLVNTYANSAVQATAINPYNIVLTQNTALFTNLTNQEIAQEGKDKITNLRVIADGTLFTMPGGKARAAVGAEYMKDEFSTRASNAQGGSLPIGLIKSLPFVAYARNITSAFAEVNLPIVGDANAMTGLRGLELAASVRYDKYSDFGNTTNPRIALTYKPLDWVSIRGNWSKSFNAPTPVDQLGGLNSQLSVSANCAIAVTPPSSVPPCVNGQVSIVIQGARQNLQPQTSKNYTIGIDIDPPAMEGLRFSASYYNIDYKGFLGRVLPTPFTPYNDIVTLYPSFFKLNPTQADVLALQAQAANPSVLAPYTSNPATSYYQYFDFRLANLGNAKISGADLAVNYRHDISIGSIDGRVSGNKQLSNYTQPVTGAPFIDTLLYQRVFTGTAALGVNIHEHFRAQASMNYSAGYNIRRDSAAQRTGVFQDRISSFTTVNLFFNYDVKGKGMWQDLGFSLNANNVLDQVPPVFTSNGGSGYANGNTLGRFIQVGVSKKFK